MHHYGVSICTGCPPCHSFPFVFVYTGREFYALLVGVFRKAEGACCQPGLCSQLLVKSGLNVFFFSLYVLFLLFHFCLVVCVYFPCILFILEINSFEKSKKNTTFNFWTIQKDTKEYQLWLKSALIPLLRYCSYKDVVLYKTISVSLFLTNVPYIWKYKYNIHCNQMKSRLLYQVNHWSNQLLSEIM